MRRLFLVPLFCIGAFLLTAVGCAEEQTALPPSHTVLAAVVTPSPTPTPVVFSDLPAADPRYGAVKYMVEHEIMEGVGGGQFAPEGMVTRAAAVTALCRMSGDEMPAYDGRFTDVAQGSWYAGPVAWACANKIAQGSSDTAFAPMEPITRAQLAVMLSHYSDYKGQLREKVGALGGWRDAAKVPEYAAHQLAWAIQTGIFAGLISDNSIQPNIIVSRAQLAQTLVSLTSHISGEGEARTLARSFSAAKEKSASLANHGQIQELVDTAAKKYGAVGLQVAVVENGRVTDSYAYGWATKGTDPMTTDHKERVASLSKVGLGLGAMVLEERGTVQLDESIGAYWGFPIQNPYHPDYPVSIRAILCHTSSLSGLGGGTLNYAPVSSKLGGGRAFGRLVPGEIGSWGYNNDAFGVLGMTLELAADKTMDEILNESLFTAMDIDAAYESGSVKATDKLVTLYEGGGVSRSVSTSKGFVNSGKPGASGRFFAGGLTTSAEDFAKITALLAGDGVYEGVRLLNASSVATMETIQSGPLSVGFYQALPLRYQQDIYGRDSLYYHTGSAYGVYNCMSYDPVKRDGVVVLTTGASAAKDANGIYAVCGEISRAIYGII